MAIALLSDIHGNRQAFEAVLEAIAARDIGQIWCLGDLVGYGADPNACVGLAREHAELCLAGNHDLAVLGTLPIDDFSAWAHAATSWTQQVIDPSSRTFLGQLEPAAHRDGFGLFHASPRDPVWEYVLSANQAGECLDIQAERIGFIGHSHVALSFLRQDGGPVTGEARVADAELALDQGKWLINPGSVGQPRDGDPRAAWLELDPDAMTVRFHRVAYDVEAAGAAIRAAGLPEGLAERLRYGQ